MEFLEPPFSKEQTKSFLKDAGLSDPPLIYAVEYNGQFVGYTIYHDYDDNSMEIGWVFNLAFWNKSIASEITEQLIEKARQAGKDETIECAPEQEVSKHIAIRFGFEQVGIIDDLEVFRLHILKSPCS